jgi:hypothetical protein
MLLLLVALPLIQAQGPPSGVPNVPPLCASAREPAKADDLGPYAIGATTEAVAPRPVASDSERWHDMLYPRFSVSAGAALLANMTSTVQVTGDAGVGTILDLEDALDVDENETTARVDATFSFNERHRLDMSYYDIRRDGSTSGLADDIVFGDITIPAGSVVSTEIDTRILKLAYRYNFVTEERTVIGASFGIHSMGIDLGLRSRALAVSESFRQELPLPLLGLHGGYALGRKWSLLADLELLQFDLGDYRGFVSDNRLSLHHDTTKHVGLGLALNGFRIDGKAADGGLEAELEFGYQAVMLYLRVYF